MERRNRNQNSADQEFDDLAAVASQIRSQFGVSLGNSASSKGCAILLMDISIQAGMVELADAADSKSADRKVMGVRPPLPAPLYLI